MNRMRSYPFCLGLAVLLHLTLLLLLLWEQHQDHTTMALHAKPTLASVPPSGVPEKKQAIEAVSVNAEEVMAEMKAIKEARAQEARAEAHHQQVLKMQAEALKQQRLQEQKRLLHLKQEAEALALAQQKKLEEEKKRMAALAQQQALREQELKTLEDKKNALKKAQILEEQRLAALKNQKIEEAKARKIAMEEAEKKEKQAAQARQEAALKEAAAKEAAAKEAAQKTRIAGVVDRYKALIIGAISEQWILPDQVDRRLSSQFRIRLAPNGAVLEVTLIRSSGDSILDRSAQSAIYKASPLPVPHEPELFNVFRDISLTVRPENAQ